MQPTEIIKELKKYNIFPVAIMKSYKNQAPEILKIWKVNSTFLAHLISSVITYMIIVSFLLYKARTVKKIIWEELQVVYKFYLWKKIFRKTNSILSISHRIKHPRVTIYFTWFSSSNAENSCKPQ